MPRPNQHRTIASERALARRIAFEREKRGMSYEGLASRMDKVGCAINASAIYKIEKNDPPRRITVDELVGFSEVFAIPIQHLLMPPELAARERLLDLLTDWELARQKYAAAEADRDAAEDTLRSYVQENPDVQSALETALSNWIEKTFDEDNKAGALEVWMWNLTRDADWGERAKAAIDEIVKRGA
jgi:transcriptional regulator with XRE-family HTH domain